MRPLVYSDPESAYSITEATPLKEHRKTVIVKCANPPPEYAIAESFSAPRSTTSPE